MNTPSAVSVLIADDEASIRNGLRSAVESLDPNLQVLGTARNGLEAWEFIQTYSPDLVITDIRMPICDGLELMKRCREALLQTEFIILSGFDDFSYAQSAIRYGARSYLLKPFKIEELKDDLAILIPEIQKNRQRQTLSDDHLSEAILELSRKSFLNQLIHNEFHYKDDLTSAARNSKLVFPDLPCQVLLFAMGQTAASSSSVELKQAIHSYLDEFPVYIWELEPSRLAALVFSSTDEETSSIHHAASRLLDHWNGQYSCPLTISIGSQSLDLLQMGHSYGIAVTALSYQMYTHSPGIFDSSVICTTPPPSEASHTDTAPLLEFIWNNDQNGILSWFRAYINTIFYIPMPPPSFIRGMLIYLVTDIQNSLKKQMDHCQEADFASPYTKINEFHSFQQMENWCASQLLQYGTLLSEYRGAEKDRIIVKAKQFINAHIDQKISAELVAESVHLSATYFATYFKARTGINFRDYVLNQKMERAKYLLTSADANIGEISYAVGYDDYRSFYRAFKNYTGYTPSEYQAQYQKGNRSSS